MQNKCKTHGIQYKYTDPDGCLSCKKCDSVAVSFLAFLMVVTVIFLLVVAK